MPLLLGKALKQDYPQEWGLRGPYQFLARQKWQDLLSAFFFFPTLLNCSHQRSISAQGHSGCVMRVRFPIRESWNRATLGMHRTELSSHYITNFWASQSSHLKLFTQIFFSTSLVLSAAVPSLPSCQMSGQLCSASYCDGVCPHVTAVSGIDHSIQTNYSLRAWKGISEKQAGKPTWISKVTKKLSVVILGENPIDLYIDPIL